MNNIRKSKLDPSTLPEDIFRILDDVSDHEVSEDSVQWAAEVFANLLRTRLKKREVRKGEDVIRGSSLGKKDRQLWYSANMPEVAEKMGGKMNFKFLYGDVIEVLLLFLAKEAGHEVTHEQYETEVDGVKGHTDAVIDGVPVDCKSASSYSYQKFANGGFIFDDPFGYIAQLSGYAHALEKTDRAGFLVCDKQHGDICFAEIDKIDIEAHPPKPRIEHLREIISQATPPPRCYDDVPEGKSGNRKLSVGCSYCPFKDTCWADANGGQGLRKFFYSRGPVWLSEVKKEPKVNEE
jgi:CRISPR/Cas system-associated exonuclease Cas4 (RecB family)